MPLKLKVWLRIAVVLCCFSLVACEVFVYSGYKAIQRPLQRIPRGSELWGGYEKGAVYELQQPVFLSDYTNFAWSYALVSGEGMTREKKRGEWNGPATVEEYKHNPGQWPFVLGVVEARTRIRCVSLSKKKAYMYELKYLAVYAKILDGPYKGKTVEITELSTYVERQSWVVRPDIYFLKRVESPDRSQQGRVHQ